jgi:hypothetical protein
MTFHKGLVAFMVTLATAGTLSAAGCQFLPGGQMGPVALSPDGITVSPLKDGQVQVRIAPGSASSVLGKVYIRAKRGETAIARHAVDWNAAKGVEIEVGSPAQPLQAGDTVEVGTSDVNAVASFPVAP